MVLGLPFFVTERNAVTETINAAAGDFPKIVDFWSGVKILLGRKPHMSPEINTANFLPQLVDLLPPTIRLYVSPNPPITDGAPVAYVFFKNFDLESKIIIYHCHLTAGKA